VIGVVLALTVGTSAAGVAGGTLSVPGRSAPLRSSLRVTDERLSMRGAPALLGIVLRAGATSQTIGVGLIQSGWPDPRVSGSPLAISDPHVTGAGQITGGFASAGGGLAVGAPVCVRGGPSFDGGGVDVSLPANSRTTLVYAIRLAALPWPGLRPTITAYAYVPAINPGYPARALGTVRFIPTGRTGVRISLATDPPRARDQFGDTVLPRGATVRITGRTEPQIRNTPVRVTAERYAEPRANADARRTTVGTTRTRHDGTFAISFTAHQPGRYLIIASLRNGNRTHLADSGCDLTLDVR
jgi:hypothetical protein